MTRIRVATAIPYSWVVVALCVMATMAVSFIYSGFGALYPFIQEELEINRAELGLMASALLGGGIASVVIAGWLTDVIGVRRLQTVMLVAVVLALLAFSQLQSLLQGILLSLALGVAVSAEFPACIKAIMDWVTPRTRGVAMGLSEASVPIAGIIAAILFTALAVTFSWRVAVIACAIIVAVATIVFFLLYKDKPSSYSEGQRGSLRVGWSALLKVKERNIGLAICTGTAFASAQVVFTAYLVLFLREDLDMSDVAAGNSLAVAMAGGVVSRIALGLVSDFMLSGSRIAPLAIVGTLAGLSVVTMAWVPSDASLGVVLVLVFLVGGCTMAWSGLWTAFLAELAGPAQTGTVVGFGSMVMRIGIVVVTPIFGLIVDRTGSYDIGWWMIAGLAGVGILLLALQRPQPRPQ